MIFPRFVVLTIACLVSVGASAVQQQNPEPTPAPAAAPVLDAASPPATPEAAPPADQAREAEETAALIAKANAAAAANAKLAATGAAAPATKERPSPQAQKKAREYGFHAEVYSGKTMFCRDDATLGTRLKSKRCMGALEFEDYSTQLKIARDLMQSKTQCQGGGLCGGVQ